MGDRLVGLASSCANGIEDLWVHRRYRRRGIAGGLIDSLVANLTQRGFRYVQVGCEDFNSYAIAFFEAQGWRRIGAKNLEIAPGRRIEARVYCCSLSEDARAEFLV